MSDIHPGLVLEGYEFIEEIGRGGFSSVYRVKSQKFNRFYVAKVAHIIEANMDGAWRAFDSEIQALLRLDHPNIINLYAHFRYNDNFVLILEYCPNGSLYDYIRDNGAMTGGLLRRTVKELCSALRCAWEQGVQHRDIKPANILVDDKGHTKLVDFGISIIGRNSDVATKVVDYRCSPICAAPEILNKVPHDPVKSDIWSLGATILWLAAGSVPWPCYSLDEMVKAIRFGQYRVSSCVDPDIHRLVRRMLMMDPDERVFPSEEEIDALTVVRMDVSDMSVNLFKPKETFDVHPPSKFSTAVNAQGMRGGGLLNRNQCKKIPGRLLLNRVGRRVSLPETKIITQETLAAAAADRANARMREMRRANRAGELPRGGNAMVALLPHPKVDGEGRRSVPTCQYMSPL